MTELEEPGPAGSPPLDQFELVEPSRQPMTAATAAAFAVAAGLKKLMIGRRRPTRELGDTLLSKTLALPIFSSDPISSVAYATEAALTVLVASSVSARDVVLPVSGAIAGLLAIVVLSYCQGVRAYASSGGSYVFAKQNLGTLAGLIAAAALLVDYVLTVAVSIAAGIFAVTSVEPSLSPYVVEISLGFVVLLTLGNLRGVRESGLLFAFPTYGFIVSLFAAIGVGVVKCTVGTCPVAMVPHPLAVGTGSLGIFVVLKAFASGSAALTGVESISNGVTAFKPPQAQNAARTLLTMAAIAIVSFMGVSYLAVRMDARPSSTTSVLSQIARGAFPAGSPGSLGYYLVQGFTFAILVLAANTSYQGFPRLAALLSRDGFFPRQFVNLGDRLVYSNGILILSSLAAGLLLAFRANVNSLIHLYVIGVFTAFTLAQAGMVRYWLRTREPGWRRRAMMNATGSVTTFVVDVIVIWTKFTAGAWMVTIAIPTLITIFYAIHRHYRAVEHRLGGQAKAVLSRQSTPQNTVVLYVEQLDAATREAFWYARRISNGAFRAIHVPFDGSDAGIRPRFFRWSQGEPHLEVLAPSEAPLDVVLEYVWRFPHGDAEFVTVVIPELFRKPSLLAAFLRHSTFSLKRGLRRERGVVVTDVPRLGGSEGEPQWVEPTRGVCVVLINRVNAASARALVYASSLGFDETAAVYFAADEDDTARVRRDWERYGIDVPLEVLDSPFRDIGEPLRAYLAKITADPQAIAVVVMPELVVSGADRLLHNHRALYLKRLLLFEPRVILTSVPYQLR
jgi:amino acid transporter